jgi:hypothetical protein
MDSLVSAGFLVAKTALRGDWNSKELIPPKVISACDCICPQFPGPYALDWTRDDEADRTEAFDEVGLLPSLRKSATAWATGNFGVLFGWPGVFYSLAAALDVRQRFFSGVSEMNVVGLGLPDRHVARFLEHAEPPPQQEGYAPEGECGVYEVVCTRQPLPSGGRFLGFELIVTDFRQLAHSWLCNSLEEHCFQKLGVRPNGNGMLPDLESAERCCAEIEKDDVGAEPGLWLPWAIMSYS